MGTDIAESVHVHVADSNPSPTTDFVVERIEAVAALFRSAGAEELYVPHMGKRLHPRNIVAPVDPVVIPLHRNAGDVGILERLQRFDRSGKRARQDLPGVKK